MLAWLVALVTGVALAVLGYAGRVAGRRAPLVAMAASARAIAGILLVALLLDAPAGPARVPGPLVALDVSASWNRAGGEDSFAAAARAAHSAAGDSLLLIGDSARIGSPPARPTDLASLVAPAVERAVATGRPLQLHSDGILDDPTALRALPGGSELVIPTPRDLVDVAPVTMDSPRVAVGGDTVEVGVRVGAAGSAVQGGSALIYLDGQLRDSVAIEPMAPWGEQLLRLRTVMPSREGSAILSAVVSVAGDQERRNDTLSTAIELSAVAGVTVVSTAPDLDLRYMLDVLRGTTALPTRAFIQVAPGQWRREGTLAPVGVEVVRDNVRRAPILVIHGDTLAFGAPSAMGAGALLLMPLPLPGDAPQWYAVQAPASPLSALLGATSWDSLPPLAVGAEAPRGEWTALVVQRSRQFERRAAIAGSDGPRRRVVVGVGGLWRWRFRGGHAADAFTAVWGGIFDWLASDGSDQRAAIVDSRLLRAGEPVVWRRGGADSVVAVTLRNRSSGDSLALTLLFEGGRSTVQSPPLTAGLYDLRVGKDSALVVVNVSRELLPGRPAVTAGPVGEAPPAAGETPRLRSAVWPFVLLVLTLCAEWLLRRRAGLR